MAEDNSPFAIASRAGAAITARIMGTPRSAPFTAKLAVNDFPSSARWAVTSRGHITTIIAATGASITQKGKYYAPGEFPAQNELPKLWLLVEGESEEAVLSAIGLLGERLKASNGANESGVNGDGANEDVEMANLESEMGQVKLAPVWETSWMGELVCEIGGLSVK